MMYLQLELSGLVDWFVMNDLCCVFGEKLGDSFEQKNNTEWMYEYPVSVSIGEQEIASLLEMDYHIEFVGDVVIIKQK